ncbi:MAG: nuclear transport factor 2 family protein [Actinomycetota bacterium]|nr:nuclear transport factor 2 family protein [Actinomycetota bacterium]
MKADEVTRAAVMEVMEDYARLYSKGDIEGILKLFDPDAAVIGTGEDEWRTGLDELREQVERDLSQVDSVSLEYSDARVLSLGDVSWMRCRFTGRAGMGESDLSLSGRMTGVFVKNDGRWMIAQSHFSIAYGEQEEGESWPD